MKKIRITEAQANMLTNLPHKKVIRVTARQLNVIRESLDDNINNNFKKEFTGLKPKIQFEGIVNEGGPTVEILELIKGVVEFILAELNNDTTNGLSPIFQKMGITRGMLFTLLSDMGLLGMTFYQLTYNEKIRKIKSVIKPIAKELMGYAAKAVWDNTYGSVKPDEMGGAKMHNDGIGNGQTDEMTGAASSGSFTGAMTMQPSKDYNDELSPSTQMGDGVLTDASSNFQELKGLEVGTRTEYFTVNDVRGKKVDDKGNTYFMITLNDVEGNLTQNHLIFIYNEADGKAFMRFNRNFEKISPAKGVLDQVYHTNLDTIGKVLTKQAQMKGEATGAAGNTGAFDANAFASAGGIGSKAGHMKTNIDINNTNTLTSKEGSKPIDIREVSNMMDTAYPDGRFVEFDDCVKLNNNKEAENGGCNSGDSGVVKIKKSGNKSVISNQKGE